MVKKSSVKNKTEQTSYDFDVDVVKKTLKSCYDFFLVSNLLTKTQYLIEIEKAMAELDKVKR